MQIDDNANGWAEYKLLVVAELARLSTKLDLIQEDVSKLREESAGLRVKSSVWGLVGGSLPGIAIVLYAILSKL